MAKLGNLGLKGLKDSFQMLELFAQNSVYMPLR